MHLRSLSSIAVVSAVVLLSSLACQGGAKDKAAPVPPAASAVVTAPGVDATGGSGPSSTSDVVVATWNTGKITMGQLDEKLSAQLMQVRRQGLENQINEMLVKEEAKKRGMSEEQLMKAEIEDKTTEPTDAEVQKLIDEAKKSGQIPEQATLEQVKPQAIPYLKSKKKQDLQVAFIGSLRKKVGLKLTAALRSQVPADGPSRGPATAPVTIVEFSDFECPYCQKAHTTVEEVMKKYPNKIRLVFRQFPLESIHQHAEKAAEGALCANEQGKFWQFHNKLFDNREHITPEDMKGYAKALGLNATTFAACLDGGKQKTAVKLDEEVGSKFGVTGTPAFFINGVNLSGAVPVEEFSRIIDSELGS